MARFESSGVVDRPVEEVWNWILTAENFPKWNALRGRSKAWWLSDGPIGIGSTMVLAAHVGPFKLEQMLRIIVFEPYRTLVFEAEGGLGSRLTTKEGTRAQTRFIFERVGGGTRVSKVATSEWPWYLAPLVALRRKRYRRFIPMLKRAIEEPAKS